MGLETGTYIADLVSTNPPNSDPESQGAGHLRLIKAVLQNTFPNATGAFPLPTSTTKTGNYSIVKADAQSVICVDTTGGSWALTLPTLASGDAGWSVETIKINAGTNPYFIQPATGTLRSGEISGLSSTRRSIVGRRTKVIWTGSAWLVDRVVGPPVASLIPFHGSVLPIGYEWPNGQTLASVATNYPDYNALIGSGLTPDVRGRAIFGLDNLGGSAASRITVAGGNYDGTVVGGSGGAQNHTLTATELALHAHDVSDPTHSHNVKGPATPAASGGSASTLQAPLHTGGSVAYGSTEAASTGITVPNTNVASNTPGGAAHTILSPALSEGYLLVVE